MSQELSSLISTLYSSTDNNTVQAASRSLNEWQQKPEAWQLADAMLGTPGMSGEYYYFFAQTLKSKIQYDMYQLPASSYTALRDSLVQKLLLFGSDSSTRATRKQLCIAIADLVIQTIEVWPNSIPDIVNLLSVDHTADLLEILKLIPEETGNMRLMVESESRNMARFQCVNRYNSVLELLSAKFMSGNEAIRELVMECFLSWLKFYAPPIQYSMSDSPMLHYCLSQLGSVSKNNFDIKEIVIDTLVEILHSSTTHRDRSQHNPLIELKIFPEVYSIVRVVGDMDVGKELARGTVELESVKSIARLLSLTGESMMVKISSDYRSDVAIQQFIGSILSLFSVGNVEVSETVLPFMEDFLHATAPNLTGPRTGDAVHAKFFESIVMRCSLGSEMDMPGGAAAGDASNPFADSDYFQFRSSNCLKLLYTLSRDFIGKSSALEKLVRGLIYQMTEASQGVTPSSGLFYLQEAFAVCAKDQLGVTLSDASDSLRSANEFLIDNLSRWVDVRTIHSCGAVDAFRRRSLVALAGSLAQWASNQSKVLSLIDLCAQVLLQPVVAHKSIHAAAAASFRDLCFNSHCRGMLTESQPHITESIAKLVMQTVSHLPEREHSVLCEGVVSLVSACPEDNLFVAIIHTMILTPLIDSLVGYCKNANLSKVLEMVERTTAVFRSFGKFQKDGQRYNAIGGIFVNQMWPAIELTLETFKTEEELVERSCRLIKHAVRATPEFGKRILIQIGKIIVRDFSLCHHSSYLYLAEVLGQEYASDVNARLALGELFDNLLVSGIRVVESRVQQYSSLSGGFGNHNVTYHSLDELVEDLFGMTERFLRFCPSIVIKSGSITNLLKLVSIVIISIRRRETIEAVSAFVEQMYFGEWTRSQDNSANEQFHVTAADVARVSSVLTELAPILINQIFTSIAHATCSKPFSHSIPSILLAINTFNHEEFKSRWIVHNGLNVIPSSVMTDRDKQKAVTALTHVDDERAVQECIEDLLYRAHIVERRIKQQQ